VRILNSLLRSRIFSGVAAVMAALALAVATPAGAVAAPGGASGHPLGGHPGFTGHPGHGAFGGHPDGHHGLAGHPHQHRFVGHPGFIRHRGFVGVGPGFAFWPAYPYDPGPAVYPEYWYYCPSAEAYYPYVETCPEAWVPVPAG